MYVPTIFQKGTECLKSCEAQSQEASSEKQDVETTTNQTNATQISLHGQNVFLTGQKSNQQNTSTPFCLGFFELCVLIHTAVPIYFQLYKPGIVHAAVHQRMERCYSFLKPHHSYSFYKSTTRTLERSYNRSDNSNLSCIQATALWTTTSPPLSSINKCHYLPPTQALPCFGNLSILDRPKLEIFRRRCTTYLA